ncbi:hypothetical protein BB561_003286 [Smittium simulii]|uniref:dolichyl-phosphate beta-glucosyltransferase n=1 Tax=Smittium simulii TaxID=133385 RepID=A0A2T9YM81_9FUNG|nr:hypothetical protein BB561_003286 [Smittium simulii]
MKLPSIFDKPTTFLSIVVPAYNEEKRLPELLDDIRAYRDNRKESINEFKYEILIMNDGSKDATEKIALEYGKKYSMPIKVVTHVVNRGKGGSVTQGVLCSAGEYILFCDADGATKFSDIDLLIEACKTNATKAGGPSIAVGSRALESANTNEHKDLLQSKNLESEHTTKVQRSSLRSFLQWGFHNYVYILGVRGIKDTQCGFKLFNRKSAQLIFSQMHVERFIFDIEVLLIASYYKIPVAEVPVNWHEVDGSKMSIVRDSIQMALDLLAVRLNYLFGLWEIKNANDIIPSELK